MSIDVLFEELKQVSEHPRRQMQAYKEQGKKIVGVLPYYAPEELVHAAGMVPMGIWGSNSKTISKAKEYCATFYCTIAQLGLEMLLDGTLDGLDGLITPTICDTLRPMSQNYRVAMEGKLKCIFLAHPQNRRPAYGVQFTMDQYGNIKKDLEEIAGHAITDEALRESIKVYNRSRAARRKFAELANQHPEVVSPTRRSVVFRSSWFMLKEEHTEKLEAINAALEAMPVVKWTGKKVVTSGIICDNPKLLQIFEENNIAIAADDVAHESRPCLVDASEEGDPMRALAQQYADQDNDVLLYDHASAENRRGEFVAEIVKKSGAEGLVLFMQQFCDPEEMEYPSLKKALKDAGIPHIKLGVDQQMRDFGQASTAIQAFADVL